MRWTLLCAAVLLGTAAHAQDAKFTGDYWNGRWSLTFRFDKEVVKTWIEILPNAERGYTARMESGAAVELSAHRGHVLWVRVADKYRTRFRVRPKDHKSFGGTVDQPDHPSRAQGSVEGVRANQFAGLFIDGPMVLTWGKTARFKVMYSNRGKRNAYGGEVKWTMRTKGPGKPGFKGQYEYHPIRTFTAPAAPKDEFAELRVQLTAKVRKGQPFADQLRRARLIVVVTDIPKKCAALDARIKRSETGVRDARARLAQVDARLAALKFPEPWKGTAGLDAAIAEEKKAIQALEDGAAKTADVMARMRRAEIAIGRFRRRLRGITTDVGRAFTALGWFKQSVKGPDEKRDFVRLYWDQRPGPDWEAEFLAAYKDANGKAVATVGVGLVQIGGLLTMIPTGGASSLRHLTAGVVATGLNFAWSTYVDQKIDSSAVLKGVKASEQAAAGLQKSTGRLGQLAKAYQAASPSGRDKIARQLTGEALRAMVHAIDTERKLRAARVLLRREANKVWPSLRKHKTTLAQLEKQKKKESLAAGERAAELRAAQLDKQKWTATRTRLAGELETAAARLDRLRALHEKHCAHWKKPERPAGLHHCVRRRLLASTYFMGGTAGWTTSGDAKDLKAVGNHIEATDLGKGHYWFFRAPGTYCGDKRAAYGSILAFELNQLKNGAKHFSGTLVALSDGKTTLTYHVPKTPAAGWTRFEVCLHESHAWKTDKGKVTKEMFLKVLANLTTVLINCEHSSGRDVGGLRNVVLYGAR